MKENTKSGKLSGFSERTSDIILAAICAVIVFIVAYPLYYVLIASFSDPYDVYAGKPFFCLVDLRLMAINLFLQIRILLQVF